MSSVSDLKKKIEDMKNQHQVEITSLNQRFEEKFASITQKYEEKISQLSQSIENLQKSIPQILSDAIDNVVKTTAESMMALIDESVNKTAAAIEKSFMTVMEKKEKKKNLVVVNLPESNDAEDWEKVEKMASLAGIEDPAHAIKTIFRDGVGGKRAQNGSIIPRILKVKFRNPQARQKFLHNNYKNLGPDFARVYVRYDLTYEERERNRALRAELHQRRLMDGNSDLIIRNGRILNRSALSYDDQPEN